MINIFYQVYQILLKNTDCDYEEHQQFEKMITSTFKAFVETNFLLFMYTKFSKEKSITK